MAETIHELVTRAKKLEMSPYERTEQRRSFVYGNTHIENDRITRELVDEIDEKLALGSQQAESK